MRVIIDRFEEEFAVCEKEDGDMMDIHKDDLPQSAKEGDVLLIEANVITIDQVATKKRKEEIEKSIKSLFNEV